MNRIARWVAAVTALVVIGAVALIDQRPTSAPVAAREGGPSVVRVVGHDCHSGIRQGTGFVIAPGVVITDAHVIAGEHDTSVIVGDQEYRAKVVVFDPSMDLAVLKTAAPLGPPLRLGSPVTQGTVGTLTGFPVLSPRYVGTTKVLYPTVLRQLDIPGEGSVMARHFYALTADGIKGDSGGPITSKTGAVEGIYVLGSGTGFGWMLAANTIRHDAAQGVRDGAAVSTGLCDPQVTPTP